MGANKRFEGGGVSTWFKLLELLLPCSELYIWFEVVLFTFSQVPTNNVNLDSTNIYYQSLKYFCESRIDTTYHIYIEYDNLTTNSIPERFGLHKITVLNLSEIKKKLKKEDELIVTKIVPLRVENGEFYVTIIDFKVTYSKRNFDFVNIGGDKYVYSFDCSSNKFIFNEAR